MHADAGGEWSETDVLVIGGGPAGIAAASICAERAAKVVLVDQSPRAGGQIWRHTKVDDLPRSARAWIERLQRSSARKLYSASVVSLTADREATLVHDHGIERIRAEKIVLATGARELFLPFPGWTLPWVVGAGGAQALVKQGVNFAGKRVVVSGSGPLLLPVAATLASSGAQIEYVLEQANFGALAQFSGSLLRTPSRLLQAAQYAAVFGPWRYHTASWVVRAEGDSALRAVEMSIRGKRIRMACDVLCTGFGLVPSVELASIAGCAMRDGSVTVDRLQQTSVSGVYAVGESCGVAGVENAIAQGICAAHAIIGREVPASAALEIEGGRAAANVIARTFAPRSEVLRLADKDTVVCRCEDVRESEIGGSTGWRELKLRTRIGMGPCQGRVCGAAMRARFGFGPGESRTPVFPAPVSTMID